MASETIPSGALDATIVVATYNRAAMLDACLRALAVQDVPTSTSWEIAIVDNNSRDRTRDVVERWRSRAPVPVHYVFEPRQGKSHALNAGIARARGAALAFTDDDVLVSAGWLRAALAAVSRWDADVVGGRILPRWEQPPPAWLAQRRQLWGALAINDFAGEVVHQESYTGPGHVWGANMTARRSAFDRLGGFDTALGPVGSLAYKHEDVDLVQRALSAGLRVVYDGSVEVFHRVPPARMTWTYICRWHWLFGESRAYQSGARPRGRHLLGMPGWRTREAARLLARCAWLTARRWPDAAALQLELMEALGALRGYQKLWLLERRGRPPSDALSAEK